VPVALCPPRGVRRLFRVLGWKPVCGAGLSWLAPCCVADGSEQELEVGAVEAGDRVAESDGSADGDAGSKLEDAALAAAGGKVPCVQGGHRGRAVGDAGSFADEGAEVITAEEDPVPDEELGASFTAVEAGASVPGSPWRARRAHSADLRRASRSLPVHARADQPACAAGSRQRLR
jgi:hypothetical protein